VTDRKLENRILGIDPGLNVTGYGVIDGAGQNGAGQNVAIVEAGVVRSTKGKTLELRLNQIYSGVLEIIESLSPSCLSLEEIFSHYERPKTAILMGHARGVINLAAARSGIPVFSYSATQVKSVLTGNGRAPKSQIQFAVMQHFNLDEPPAPHDVADALAIGLCHAFLGRFESTHTELQS